MRLTEVVQYIIQMRMEVFVAAASRNAYIVLYREAFCAGHMSRVFIYH